MAEYLSNGVIGDYILYKDKPLVRNGNMFCYGDMQDPYVLFLMVVQNGDVKVNDKLTLNQPTHVLVQVMSTDQTKSPMERLAKQFEKNSLYDALDIGLVWLDRLNKK